MIITVAVLGMLMTSKASLKYRIEVIARWVSNEVSLEIRNRGTEHRYFVNYSPDFISMETDIAKKPLPEGSYVDTLEAQVSNVVILNPNQSFILRFPVGSGANESELRYELKSLPIDYAASYSDEGKSPITFQERDALGIRRRERKADAKAVP